MKVILIVAAILVVLGVALYIAHRRGYVNLGTGGGFAGRLPDNVIQNIGNRLGATGVARDQAIWQAKLLGPRMSMFGRTSIGRETIIGGPND